MRICILRHSQFPPDATVTRELNCLIDEGHSVDLICLRHEGQPAVEHYRGAARFIRIPVQHRRGGFLRYTVEYLASFLLMGALVTALHARRRYDCVQVNTMPDFLVFAAFLPKLFGAKVLLHLHEPTPELWMTKFKLESRHVLYRLQARLEQWAIRYADQALTVSESLRARFGERGADLRKIRVLPNVCDEKYERIQPRRPPPRDGLFRLLTHGLIEERYGHELVLQAVQALRDECPALRYQITGEGDHAPVVEARIRELHLEDRVLLEGYLPFDDLMETLHACDAGVIPMRRSPYSELIDTCKMYELIALRKPVISSRLPTVESHFDDSCLLYFTPDDPVDLARCIRELLADEGRRRKRAENAFRRYQELKWSVTKHEYLDVLERLVLGASSRTVSQGEPAHASEDFTRHHLL